MAYALLALLVVAGCSAGRFNSGADTSQDGQNEDSTWVLVSEQSYYAYSGDEDLYVVLYENDEFGNPTSEERYHFEEATDMLSSEAPMHGSPYCTVDAEYEYSEDDAIAFSKSTLTSEDGSSITINEYDAFGNMTYSYREDSYENTGNPIEPQYRPCYEMNASYEYYPDGTVKSSHAEKRDVTSSQDEPVSVVSTNDLEYDENGNVIRDYSDDGSDGGSRTVTSEYDSLGRVIHEESVNASGATVWSRDVVYEDGEIFSVASSSVYDESGNLLDSYVENYDADGNKVCTTATDYVEAHGFDRLGNLTNVKEISGGSLDNSEYTWYDDYGNKIGRIYCCYDGSLQVDTYEYRSLETGETSSGGTWNELLESKLHCIDAFYPEVSYADFAENPAACFVGIWVGADGAVLVLLPDGSLEGNMHYGRVDRGTWIPDGVGRIAIDLGDGMFDDYILQVWESEDYDADQSYVSASVSQEGYSEDMYLMSTPN